MHEKDDYILSIVGLNELDWVEYVNLQKDGYMKLHEKVRFDNSFITPEFYKWKYKPPAGEGKICIVKSDNKMIAAIAICPFILNSPFGKMKIWQCCDGTTLDAHRKSGLYHKILLALHNWIPANELMYGFPNNRAGTSGAKVARPTTVIPYWVSINLSLPFGRIDNEIQISQINNFDNSFDEFSVKQNRDTCVVEKSSDYLRWRYLKNPNCTYTQLAAFVDSKLVGFLVYRKVSLMDTSFTVIMEWQYNSTSVKNALLLSLKRKTHEWRIVNISNSWDKNRFFYSGFVQLPNVFVPKKQYFFVTSGRNERTTKISNPSWVFWTGDWDGF